MSTQIHTDGIKTIVHTSKWAADRQADFLRRSGCDDGAVGVFYSNAVKSEQAAHHREYDRIAYCRSLGLPE